MTSPDPGKQPQTKDATSMPLSPIVKPDGEWNTWRQSYITTAPPPSVPALTPENEMSAEKQPKDETPSNDDALEVSRQWIVNKSKTQALNGSQLGTLLHRLLCEQEEIMDRQISKPWTIIRPKLADVPQQLENDGTITDTQESKDEELSTISSFSSSQSSMLRQIEWHVVLLLELWIQHGERLVQELYPRLLVLQYARQEAQKKEEKIKRKWKRMNRPGNQNKAVKKKLKQSKHGGKEPKSSLSKFSASKFRIKQLAKYQKVMEQTPALVNRMQTATPQDKELQLLNHIATIVSQAAFFLPGNESMTAFLTSKCLSPRIWKVLPQVVTHVYDDLERSNPYLELVETEDPFPSINILTTTKKKKKKKKTLKPKQEEEKKEEPVGRPKLLQKKNRFQTGAGHFYHRSRAAQSSMSKVLEHLSPVRNKSSIALASASSTGKNNRFLSRKSSSELVTPHLGKNKSAKQGSVNKTPKLSLSSTTSSKKKTKASMTPSATTTANKASRKPAPVTTAKKEDRRPKKIKPIDPVKSIRRDAAEFPLPVQLLQTTNVQSPDCKLSRAKEEDNVKTKRSRSQGLFPLSPIPTNRSSTSESTIAAAAVLKTPTRKRRSDSLLSTTTTPVRKPYLEADGRENERNHGNKRPPNAPFLTPQRYHCQKVAETPDSSTFPAPKKAAYATPVRRRCYTNNAVVAETPDTSAPAKLLERCNESVVAETPQRQPETVAETPQHPTTTGVVAETPEQEEEVEEVNKVASIGGFDSIDWETPSSPSQGGSDVIVEPLQLFTKPPEAKKPRRVYSLGGGRSKQPQQQEKKTDKDEMKDRRMATNAVLTQAMAFMRRKSLERSS
ncbi:unnamed protein product [Cylindrotheca closterium]|uniref:Uncharacterized protein n=1 Tax=Cylindrotheca closterium TaxID=2856 RepID=A0AAD2CDI0_9STRA|nr:unnamed protein product [Cylindrotheca closterium]